MSDLIVIINETATIESISDSAAQAFGYKPHELNGKSSQQVLEIPGRPSNLTPPLSWLSASPHPILHAIKRDGTRFPLRLTQHEIHGGGGQTHYVLLLQPPNASTDEREDFVRDKQLYELATTEGRISVWEVDFRTNNFEFSPVMGKMLGLAEEQIPTTVEGWKKHFHPDDWALIERDAGRMIRREITEMNVECRMFHEDGSVLWGLVRGKVIFDENGQPVRSIGTNIDITERKSAEIERDLFFTLSIDLLCIADTGGFFRRVNPAFSRTLGFTCEELQTAPFLDFVHPEDRDATIHAMMKLRSGENVVRFENRYRCKDNSYRWLSWMCPAAKPGSELLYAVAHDVTEEKRVEAELKHAVEQAERANSAKSDFLSRMSHELRTPLNAILGFGQLLQRDKLSPRQHDQIDLVVKAGRHLLHLINEVLDITRIEVGRLNISPEPVDLAELLSEVVDLTRPLAAVRNISIQVGESARRDYYVVADKQRLKQVMLNLVSNAIKYNYENGLVTLHSEVNAQGRILVHVQDTGQGIPPAMHHRMFIPFDRLGAEATAVEGSGLGLVLSRRLIEIMGGSLTFVSQPNSGTTFSVELPAAMCTLPGVGAATVAPRAVDPPAGPTRSLLCIEDNHANIRLIEAVLASRPNLKLLTAMQALVGLDLAKQQRPDMILLDVHLPDMNGDDVLTMLRADDQLRNIPVVVISADATARQIDRLLKAGACEYITKPIDVDQLLQILDRYLAKSK